MSVLFIEREAMIEFDNNYLIIRDRGDIHSIRQIPMQHIEMIVANSDIELKGSIIKILMEQNVPLLLRDGESRRIEGMISYPGGTAATITLMQQVKKAHNPDFACELGKSIISGKVQNQIRYLKKRAENAKTDRYDELIEALEALLKRAMRVDSVARLRGYEGLMAKKYFQAFPILVNHNITFPKRVNRDPTDIINVFINIGYSYIGSIIYNQLMIHNLKPDIGFLHSDHGSYPTLMYDMLEEWRTLLVDQVVIGMVNKGMIKPGDYYISPETGKLMIDHDLKEKLRNLIFDKLQSKVRVESNRVDGDGRIIMEERSYTQLIERQVRKLKEVIISNETIIYQPYTGN